MIPRFPSPVSNMTLGPVVPRASRLTIAFTFAKSGLCRANASAPIKPFSSESESRKMMSFLKGREICSHTGNFQHRCCTGAIIRSTGTRPYTVVVGGKQHCVLALQNPVSLRSGYRRDYRRQTTGCSGKGTGFPLRIPRIPGGKQSGYGPRGYWENRLHAAPHPAGDHAKSLLHEARKTPRPGRLLPPGQAQNKNEAPPGLPGRKSATAKKGGAIEASDQSTMTVFCLQNFIATDQPEQHQGQPGPERNDGDGQKQEQEKRQRGDV